MFSDIAGVRAALKERLAASVPAPWQIDEFIREPPTEYRSPQVLFEFSRFERTVNGQPLASGFVAAVVDILVGSPLTIEGEGEGDADDLALTLVRVIDNQSDMYWDSAEKQKLPAGQWAWRIHTIVITESKE